MDTLDQRLKKALLAAINLRDSVHFRELLFIDFLTCCCARAVRSRGLAALTPSPHVKSTGLYI